EQAQVLRRTWGEERNVWVAASTHEGEDELVLEAFDRVVAALPDCLLLLVPRHPERSSRVADLAGKQGLITAMRSELPERWKRVQVLVGDTMGELPLFYAAADAAFVGGSLVPHGGHNMLEPAALGKPVIAGRHLFNFAEIGRLLHARQALRSVDNAHELADTVLELLKDGNLRHNMGERGRLVVEENRGALERVTALVDVYLTRADTALK
ncbi:MAG: glycosyltransferase, partial [Gammaproteobacteria bacterium]|nr:glycosyltransferase [Gammaproteobacteria bacterium]